MTGPQTTVVLIALFGTAVLGAAFYPGVRRQGASKRNSFWAALMAASLCAVAAALFAGALHNGVLGLWVKWLGN